jgi:hypothetical protein
LTGIGPEDRTKFYWYWAGGQNKVLLVLGRRTEQSFTGIGPEDRTKFDWYWAGGPVLIMRTVLSTAGSYLSVSVLCFPKKALLINQHEFLKLIVK